MRRARVTLVGSPNSGKTTLFNWITGSRFRTVNYPGSTVEYSIGRSLEIYGPSLEIVDTPGIYSLTPKSPEEEITQHVLFKEHSDLVIVVVDGSNLTRHLLLAAQLLEAQIPILLAVTMRDLLEKDGLHINTQVIEKYFKQPCVGIDGRLGGGVKDLMSLVSKRVHELEGNDKACPLQPVRWTQIKFENVNRDIESLVKSAIITPSLIKGTPSTDRVHLELSAKVFTRRVDQWILHPWFGLFFFSLIMTALFASIFWLAAPVMDLIDSGFGTLAQTTLDFAPEALWAQFLSQGVVASFGAIFVFVPQTFILFGGLTILEDSGYLARAATLVDRPLRAIGLNGRAFAPILSGYACAIPAMMAARTISNRKERWLTLFMLPLMSCSARLPVYALLLGFLLPGDPWLSGLILTALYLGGLFLGAIVTVILSKFIPSDSKSLFILELPIYRAPQLRSVFQTAFSKTLSFATRAGPMIFVISALIWVATTFPNSNEKDPSLRLGQSWAGRMGHVVEPLMEPMGSDWRVGVGLISAFAAREVFVSAMAVIFQVSHAESSDDGESDESLSEGLLMQMREAKTARGDPLFTTSSVVGLILFFMIALQCMSTVSVARQESGSLKFAVVQLLVFNSGAYVVAVGSVQFLRALGVS